MGRGWTVATAIVAVIAFAPWAVYVAGLGKLTQAIVDHKYSQAWKQTIIMLEWYTVSAQFLNLVLILIACIARKLSRTHSAFIMFLAVNTGLIILRATERIWQITAIHDGVIPAAALGVVVVGDPLTYLRAEAAGQVATATCNFILAILIGMAGTVQGDSYYRGQAAHVA